VRGFLEKRGYQTFTEVPAGRRIMDIVAARGKTVVGVEVKVENWRKAFCQALDYKAFCSYVYLAMWSRKIHLVNRAACRRARLGLLSVGYRNVREAQVALPNLIRRKLPSIQRVRVHEEQERISALLLEP